LSYTPAKGQAKVLKEVRLVKWFRPFFLSEKRVRAADAKEVGVGNPAEETYRHPNKFLFPLFATIELGASLSTSFQTGRYFNPSFFYLQPDFTYR